MGLILNLDCDWFFHSRKKVPHLVDEAYARRYISQYKGTTVSDIFLNVGGLMSSTPSKVRTTYFERLEQLKKDGKEDEWACAPVLKKLTELGIDTYTVWIDQLRRDGINPWLSFRMNDAHNLLIDDDPLISPQLKGMFKTCAVIRHHRQIGWYDRCQDYSVEEVRRYHLDYIEEQTMQYLPHGIELDFQRELNCFRPGHEWDGMEIMLDFVKEVKEIVTRAEKKAGHKIKIALRCNQNPQYCMEWGFDIIEMARLGLIDVFVASPRWNCTDTDIPVKLWKRILAPYNIPVLAAIDNQQIHPYPDHFKQFMSVRTSVDMTLAMASNFLTQGADGIYLFNYFSYDPNEMIDAGKREFTDCNSIEKIDGYYKVLMTAGCYEKAIEQKRRHVITYIDKGPLYRKNNAPLPLIVGGEYIQGFHSNGECNPRYLRFATGTIPKGKAVTIRFNIPDENFDVNDIEVFLNCVKVDFAGKTPLCDPDFSMDSVYTFSVPEEALKPEIQVAEFLLKEGKVEKQFMVHYADLIIE